MIWRSLGFLAFFAAGDASSETAVIGALQVNIGPSSIDVVSRMVDGTQCSDWKPGNFRAHLVYSCAQGNETLTIVHSCEDFDLLLPSDRVYGIVDYDGYLPRAQAFDILKEGSIALKDPRTINLILGSMKTAHYTNVSFNGGSGSRVEMTFNTYGLDRALSMENNCRKPTSVWELIAPDQSGN